MKLYKGLPLFNAVLDEDKYTAGVSVWGFVENPGTQQPLFKFNNHEQEEALAFKFHDKQNGREGAFKFGVSDDDRRLVTSIGMVADTPIYRKMILGGEEREFFMQFPADVVERMAFKFMKDQHTKNVNLDHDHLQMVNGVYVVESYIFDQSRGMKVPEYLKDATNGSWVLTFKIDNDEVWSDIQAGKYGGISLEGDFGLKLNLSKNFAEIEKSTILAENISTLAKFNHIKKVIDGSR
jgi:Putative phage serine protease XkdF